MTGIVKKKKGWLVSATDALIANSRLFFEAVIGFSMGQAGT
ncbi:hypothetical protein GY50_0699 [Dehalococcoides mccartyi GY50]|nr:hypothetical protein GY50_0699 [Dehalococcoides mccartyi GY50]